MRAVLLVHVLASLLFCPALASAELGLDGTWAGGRGATQVIVAGGEVIGFFWHGDYRPASSSSKSAKGIEFRFAGGSGTLSQNGSGAALAVREGSRAPVAVPVRRD